MCSRQNLAVAIYVALTVCISWSPASRADDAPQIDQRFRVLISAAAAIDRQAFEKIATSSTTPASDSFNEHSLTAELMMQAFKPLETIGDGQRQFRFLTDRQPKPAELAREMYRAVGGGNLRLVFRPVTMIQSERITRCQATVAGDQATGSFDFHVPKLYEGSADFVATKVDGEWVIVEFKMETLGIHITRDDEGKWIRVERQAEEHQPLRAVYIYAHDRGTARQLEVYLKSKLIEVESFRADDLDPSLFAKAELIIIGWDTFRVWQSWKQSGQIVRDANLPVIAMGHGGFEFLGRLKLRIGAPEGVQRSSGLVRPVNTAEFWNGFPKLTPANGLHQVVTESTYAGVYLPEAVDGVIPIGQEPADEDLYPLLAQEPHYFLWGYTGVQDKMTETGKELLVWSCRYTASMNRKDKQ